MRIEPLLLAHGVGGKHKARWRTLTGADELVLFGRDFAGAVEWLSSMLADGEGCIDGTDIQLLDLEDLDRLFEAVYRALFGSTAELRHRCAVCGESYELTLALDDLFSSRDSQTTSEQETVLPGGTSVRSLRVADLLAAGADEKELVERAVTVHGSDGEETISAAIERLSASRIDTVETVCPHCNRPQAFSFDLSAFLLSCCARERPILLREIHLLARTYGWSFADLCALDRTARHELVRICLAAAAARPRGRAA